MENIEATGREAMNEMSYPRRAPQRRRQHRTYTTAVARVADDLLAAPTTCRSSSPSQRFTDAVGWS
jgi:hypothetical protein